MRRVSFACVDVGWWGLEAKDEAEAVRQVEAILVEALHAFPGKVGHTFAVGDVVHFFSPPPSSKLDGLLNAWREANRRFGSATAGSREAAAIEVVLGEAWKALLNEVGVTYSNESADARRDAIALVRAEGGVEPGTDAFESRVRAKWTRLLVEKVGWLQNEVAKAAYLGAPASHP